MGLVLKTLIGAHKVELIRILLTESRQDGDLLSEIEIVFAQNLNNLKINLQYVPQSVLGAHTMDGSSKF